MKSARMFGWGFTVDNVNEALPLALRSLYSNGVDSESRGLKVRRMLGPVTTVYQSPARRVLFDPVRDANPFFHLIGDALWLLSGSQYVDLPCYFLPRYRDFSDDGATTHAPYGFRLRHWGDDQKIGGLDQIHELVKVLRAKPDTRQAVLSIWDPTLDLGIHSKDIPCNDLLMFEIVDGALNMTVCNRSNDAIWGTYGANVVQFSILQEVIASLLGVHLGRYVQFSNNFHVYLDNPYWKAFVDKHQGLADGHIVNPYMLPEVQPWPMALTRGEAERLLEDAEQLAKRAETKVDLSKGQYKSPFFNCVVVPMVRAYDLAKLKAYPDALSILEACEAPDWKLACQQWINRRAAKAAEEKQA